MHGNLFFFEPFGETKDAIAGNTGVFRGCSLKYQHKMTAFLYGFSIDQYSINGEKADCFSIVFFTKLAVAILAVFP